ncbi:MAG: transposase [Promethearchaeota archaeon]
MDEKRRMNYKEYLRYKCIFCTKEYKSIFKTEDLKEKMREIIHSYFELNEDVERIAILINLNHVEITFKIKESTLDLTRLISNFKSVTSRKFLQHLQSINSDISGIWTKNYLLATQENLLDQKKEIFLETQ